MIVRKSYVNAGGDRENEGSLGQCDLHRLPDVCRTLESGIQPR